jgi:hypothetical protein
MKLLLSVLLALLLASSPAAGRDPLRMSTSYLAQVREGDQVTQVPTDQDKPVQVPAPAPWKCALLPRQTSDDQSAQGIVCAAGEARLALVATCSTDQKDVDLKEVLVAGKDGKPYVVRLGCFTGWLRES